MAVGLLRQEPGTVGALGTMTDPRVWDSDDDKRSGTSRSVHDGRSHRPDNKRERRVLCTGNNAAGRHGCSPDITPYNQDMKGLEGLSHSRGFWARREYHAPSLPLMTASFSMGHQARKEHQRW